MLVVIDAQPAKAFVNANSDLCMLNEDFVTEEYAICIAKNNSSFTSKVNDALNVLINNGTIDNIISNYIGENASKQPYEPTGSGENGTLTIAVNAYFEPYEYYNNGKVSGIDIDISNAIADYLWNEAVCRGYGIRFHNNCRTSSGKADMGISGITVTEERKEKY